ncbi:hypothetical protein BDN72DRAFT_903821 [Pluteus cervinus]|uniref:Uncharacterized protein n=1 Tax=Pluteus cervinus TaxID=181527 RepID=A0ACD3A7S6_9AGAR|nr:hypothetical protein BDN72DRAFT_903821 [Pluteus cervinus]
MTFFPAEIIEQFVLHLNEDTERIEALIACSLVSQTWCAIVQPFLYNPAVLDFDVPREAASLINAISKYSHIRSFIHQLLIVGSVTSIEPSNATLITLGDLPSLQSLRVRCSGRTVNRALFVGLGPVFNSKSLTSLELSDLGNFPAELLYNCLALQNLAIRHVAFKLPTSSSALDAQLIRSQPKEPPVLKSLILSTQYREGSNTLEWLLSPLSPFDFSQLETFIGLDRCDMIKSYEAHCKFIAHTSHSLKTVLIDPPSSCLSEGLQDPLSGLEAQKLESISNMTISVLQEPRNQLSTLPWLIALLSGLPNPETLHELILLCDLYGHVANDTFYTRGWSQMDALLTRFHNLQKVHLKCYDERDDQKAEDLVAWFHTQLPTLVDKGILFIECFTDLTYTLRMETQLIG